MISNKKSKKISNLCGVAYIRAVNTPKYIEYLSNEAKNLPCDPKLKKAVADYFIKNFSVKNPDDNEIYKIEGLDSKMNAFVQKANLTLGKKEFLESKVEFNLSTKQTIIYDIITEITVKDGIVTKIAVPNLSFAYGDS